MANQIECPVCGIMIEIGDHSGDSIECPNCHEMVTSDYAQEKSENEKNANRRQSSKPKKRKFTPYVSSNYTIIGDNDYKNHLTGNDGFKIDAVSTTKYDEDGVKKELVDALVNKDYVPLDIFDKLRIENICKYYLPYQLFDGTYQVPWNATYKWHESVNYVENGEKKVTFQERYGESNGIADGKFSYLCLVCSGNNIPQKVYEKAKKKSSVLEKVVPYSSDIEEENESIIVMPDSSFEANWKNKIAKDILAKGKEDAEKQARSNEDGALLKAIGTGVSLQNYNYQVNIDLSVLKTILIPFWYAEYSYQDQHYWFVMDGGGRFKEIEAPKNEKEIAEVEENEKKKTSGIWVIVLFLLVSSIILGWICSSWLVFLGLAALGVVISIWASNKDEKVDKLNKEVRNENQKRRQELAQGLLSDWPVNKNTQLNSNKREDKKELKVSENDDYLDSII